MIAGCLGEIPFEVSDRVLRTIRDASWSGSVNIATHKRLGGDALTEPVGVNPDQLEFSMQLSAYLGVDVMAELRRLWKYEREFTPLALVLGDHAYGKYRWLIQSHSIKMEHYDARGSLSSCTVGVKLIEYLRK